MNQRLDKETQERIWRTLAERISDEESATREVTDELIGTVVVVAVLLFSVVWYFGVSQ